MICFPPCASCTGLCKQESVRARRETRNVPRTASGSGPGYIRMTCSHYTTPEEQARLAQTTGIRLPKRKRYWCEACGSWRNEKTTRRSRLPVALDKTGYLINSVTGVILDGQLNLDADEEIPF